MTWRRTRASKRASPGVLPTRSSTRSQWERCASERDRSTRSGREPPCCSAPTTSRRRSSPAAAARGSRSTWGSASTSAWQGGCTARRATRSSGSIGRRIPAGPGRSTRRFRERWREWDWRWGSSRASWVRSTDLPVMAERINHAAQMPPIRVLHGGDLSGTRRQCLREHRVRIRHGEDHPNRPTAQRLRTEVVMLGRLISHPELRAVHGQPSHDPTVGSLHTVDLDRPECRLVELNSTGAVPYRQHRRDRTGDGSPLVPHLDRRCSRTEALYGGPPPPDEERSERRRVGKEGRSRWSPV